MAKYVGDNALLYFYKGIQSIFAKKEEIPTSVTRSGLTFTAKNADGDTLFTFAQQDTTYSEATSSAAGLMSSGDKTKLTNIAAGAEVNQNAFSNVKVGSTTIAADTKTDTLELVAGSNVTLTPDASGDKVTIAATDTTYSDATTSASGLMSASDKTKLGGIAEGAEVNQNAFSNITVGSTTIAADSKTDTITFTAGSNITLTPDATNDSITIAATNTTYTNESLGQGYATCSTAEATAAKAATLSGYNLVKGGVVSVKFTYAVPANATLNVNSKGAKNIYYRGARIVAGVIKAGDIATFMYDGTQYQLLAVDRPETVMTQAQATAGTSENGMLITPKVLSTTIANAIAGVTQISYLIVTTLPETGDVGIIYLIAHSHGTQDVYDEYIWTGTAYEKIGNTDVDLSGYWAKADLTEITNAEIDTILATVV